MEYGVNEIRIERNHIAMKKILVAEDEQAIREFVVINLKRAGYDAY